MTAGFIGLLSLVCGLLAGYLLCKEQVWRLEESNRELRRDLAYAVGHPVTRETHDRRVVQLRRVDEPFGAARNATGRLPR